MFTKRKIYIQAESSFFFLTQADPVPHSKLREDQWWWQTETNTVIRVKERL